MTQITRPLREIDPEVTNRLLLETIDALDEGFVLYDPEDRLVFCNQKYKDTFVDAHLMVPGVQFENLVREGVAQGLYLGAIGREDEWLAERFAAHVSGNSTTVQKHSNGRTLRLVERRLTSGHTVGFRIDITELVEATELARQLSEAKSMFLASMSHEIRTPMNAIIGLAHMLQKSSLTEEQGGQLQKLQGAADHLLTVINDILDFSKIEAGKMQLELADFDPERVVENICSLMQEKAEAKSLALVLDLRFLPASLHGDGMRLGQILLNLVSNAVKFTASGSILIRGWVESAADIGMQVRFEVTDTGIGLTQDQCRSLFQPFVQADRSITRTHGGTGLGLAISNRMVELMNGEIGVHSSPGQGSTFWVNIPFGFGVDLGRQLPGQRYQPHPVVANHAEMQLKKRGGGYVLLVEDNAINQEIALDQLRSVGLTADLAENGEVAVYKARHHGYELILMDIMMPVLGGLGAAQQIRQLPGHEHTPIIALTANAFGEDCRACIQAGMNDHIAKPVKPQVLYAGLLRWLPAQVSPALQEFLTSLKPALVDLPVTGVAKGVSQVAKDGLAELMTIPGLDVSAAMLCVDDTELYRRLLATLFESRDDAQLCQAIADKEFPKAHRAAHSLRGACALLGLTSIQKQAGVIEGRLETVTADFDASTVMAEARQLRQEFQGMVEKIRAVL